MRRGGVDDHDQGITLEAVAGRLVQWFEVADRLDNIRFLFAPTHRESVQEFGLSAVEAVTGETPSLRVDHSFVTADGVRWIVDYKFAEPPDTDGRNVQTTEVWVARQCAQYAPQLAAYREAFAVHDRVRADAAAAGGVSPQIVTALYFPWLDRLQRCE